MKKYFAAIAVMLLMITSLCACAVSTSTGKAEDASLEASESYSQKGLFLFGDASEASTAHIDDKDKMDSCGRRSYLDPTNRDESIPDNLYYDGKDIVIYTDFLENEWNNYGILVYINGILQNAVIERDGVYLGNANECDFDLVPGAQTTIKTTFRPNIGKAGDVLELQMFAIAYPSYVRYGLTYFNDKTFIDDYTNTKYHWTFSLAVADLSMKVDADTQAVVSDDYSGMKITGLDTVIKDFCDRYYDRLGNNDIDIYLCRNTEDIFDIDEGLIYNTIQTERSDNTQFDIIMFGKPGTYRIGLYVNGVIQPVFDGAYQADVTIEKDKQTTLSVSLDTTDYDDLSMIYIIRYNADEEDWLLKYSVPWLSNDSAILALK